MDTVGLASCPVAQTRAAILCNRNPRVWQLLLGALVTSEPGATFEESAGGDGRFLALLVMDLAQQVRALSRWATEEMGVPAAARPSESTLRR